MRGFWPVVVMLCMYPFDLLADGLPPQPEERRVFIGYLHHEGVGLTADEAVRKLDRNDALFDSAFHAALQAPAHAEALVRFPPLPEHLRIERFSPRWFMQRHLVIEYPIVVDAQALIELLRRTGWFGYLNEVREGGWSLVPNDPYYPTNSQSAPHIGVAYRSQSWFFNQMNFPAAWDIATGHALVGMMDSGIDSTHPTWMACCVRGCPGRLV